MDPDTRAKIVAIIDEIDDMTIATVRPDGYPQATTVSYVNDGLTIYFGTGTDAQKARNIAANDRVSVTINRPYEDWDHIVGLSIGGRASRIGDPKEFGKCGDEPQLFECRTFDPGGCGIECMDGRGHLPLRAIPEGIAHGFFL